jgi:hypothetical protein
MKHILNQKVCIEQVIKTDLTYLYLKNVNINGIPNSIVNKFNKNVPIICIKKLDNYIETGEIYEDYGNNITLMDIKDNIVMFKNGDMGIKIIGFITSTNLGGKCPPNKLPLFLN